MKFEIIDRVKDDYMIVKYKSGVIPDLTVFIKILFALGIVDKMLHYGYGEYETHTSEEVEAYFANDFDIYEVIDNEEEFDLSDYVYLKKLYEKLGETIKGIGYRSEFEKDLIYQEAKKHFDKNFKDYEYYDLEDKIEKDNINSFANGGIIKLSDYFSNPDRFIDYRGQFLYPPRIESKLQPISLDKFDNGDYVGQPKLNGSNTSVTISESVAIPKERHNTFFSIPPKFDFKSLHRGKGFMCLTGEFMNKSKKDNTGKPFRGFCIWDIVAYNNKILVGSTIEERISLLNKLYPSGDAIKTKEGVTYLYKTNIEDIYKVNNFYGNFADIYDKISKVDMVEGFVLKRKSGKLEMMTREQNNVGWSVKVRKPTSNYKF
jgi:hypothetical protein